MTDWLRKIFQGPSETTPRTNNWYVPPVDESRDRHIPEELRKYPFRYSWDGTGIAVDPINECLILYQSLQKQVLIKKYSFFDVREWSYEIPGYNTTQTYGNVGLSVATGVAMQNYRSIKEANNRTGLTITVKDIDYPEWFVKFQRTKTVKTDLARWMEILNQHVNNDRSVSEKNMIRALDEWIGMNNQEFPEGMGHKGTGILLNTSKKALRLFQYFDDKPVTKEFLFSDVIAWDYVTAPYPDTNGSGVRTAIKLQVNDDKHPEWEIKIPLKTDVTRTGKGLGVDRSNDIDRWRESVIGETKPVRVGVFCSICGEKLSEKGKFCSNCGERVR